MQPEQGRQLDQQEQRRADDHAPGQAIDPHPARQDQYAEDLPDLVHGSRDLRHEEDLVGVENGDHQPADAEQDRRNGLDAQEIDRRGKNRRVL